MTQPSSLAATIVVAVTCTAIVIAILLSLRTRAHPRTGTPTDRGTQNSLLRAVLAHSPSALYVKDLNGRFLYVNNAFLTTFGVTEAGVLGQTDDYLNPTLAPLRQANDRRAHAGPIHLEETAEVDGEHRTYESQKFPLYDPDGQLYAICGTTLDVTDQRRAARAADRANAETIAIAHAATDHLSALNQAIRAPMKGVLALSTRLMGTHLDITQRRYAIAIHAAGNSLLNVVSDGLDHALNGDPVEPTPGVALVAEAPARRGPDTPAGDLPDLRLRAAAGRGPAGWPSPDGPTTAGLRILVVGTGPDRPVLEDDLRRWHMVVTSTHTASAALTTLRAAAVHGRPFEVLLLDADPGDIDTTELPGLVIAADDIPDTRIVILNRTPSPGDATSTCLAKPVHRSALYELLAQDRPAQPLPVTFAPGAKTPIRPEGTRTASPVPHRNGSW
jgi:PAS domain S-box-containing protein